MPADAKKGKSAKDRLRDAVETNVSILDEPKAPLDESPATIETAAVRESLERNRRYGDLPLSRIEPDPDQVRRVDTRSDGFEELVASVREHGVLEPITVRWIETRRVFQIITGERRYQAARRAELKMIPAVVRDVTDTKKAIHQLVENIQRENMNPVEEAKAFRRYLAATGSSQQELARQVGKSKTYVSRMIEILEKLTVAEQDDLARVAPAQLPGKSLFFEAFRIDDPRIRRSILRGELTREQARQEVKKRFPRSRGRPKNAEKRFALPALQATVTVRFAKPSATQKEIWDALAAATARQADSIHEDDGAGGKERRSAWKDRQPKPLV